MNINDEKAAAREVAFARRKIAFETVQYDLAQNMFELSKAQKTIACYMPMRTEISPIIGMEALISVGKEVCVPIIQGRGVALKFYRWSPQGEMEKGEFGALIPVDRVELVPDFVFAPLVAYDDQGTRLGYGGGFYDRTLAALRSKDAVPYVGLAFEAQKAASTLPREKTDIPLDGVVTEKGFHVF